ncbi:MAG TPA: hypothetical protein VLL95_14025 [Phnomibacter sp.]|nr:hypothetical protein [Phnomibacter sp.]
MEFTIWEKAGGEWEDSDIVTRQMIVLPLSMIYKYEVSFLN